MEIKFRTKFLMYPDRLLVCWAAQPCMQQQQQPNKKNKKLTFCFNFQLIICGSCAKLVLIQRGSASVKGWKLEAWKGEEKHRPGGKASCNVLFRVCTLSLLPFESTQNYLHLRGNWTAHQSISKSQIFCDSSLVWSPRLPLVPPLASHPDSDKLLLCSARLKIKSI